MNPWLFSEVVIETFPDPRRSDPPSATWIEWTEIDDDEPSSPAPSAVVKVGMQTSLVGPGTLRGLQLEAVLHEPLPAFPVQVAVHDCAWARMLPLQMIRASKAAGRKKYFVQWFFIAFS
jgi:hypothetical protein